jgi:hypothetical protein
MGEFDKVEVRNRYTGDWGAGFELHDTETTGDETRFKVRRRSDGAVLPDWFSAMDIRPPQSPRDHAVEPGSDADGRSAHVSPSGEASDAARDDQVLDLRSSGSSFAAIARSVGFAGAREANAAFHRALGRCSIQDRRTIRDAEFARLESLEQRVRADTRLAADRREKRLHTIDLLRDRLLAN